MNCTKHAAILALVTAAMALAVASCGDPVNNTDPVTPKTTISVTPSSAEIPPQGGSVTINVTSNGVWSVVFDSWLKVSPSSGTGNGTVTISADANNDAARTGGATFKTSDASAVVSLSQAHFDKYSKIADIRALYKGSDVEISDDIWIKGTVVSDYRHTDNGGLNNNTSQKGIVLQDDSAGIQLYCSANNESFGFGDVVEVSLKGQTISTYSGLMQVNGIPLANITKIGSETPSPKEISAAELLTNKFESQYVAVRDVQVVAADLGKTFSTSSAHTSINMESRDGDKFILFTSKYASFKDEKVPQGSGTLKGVACVYYEKSQIILAQKSDADGLTGKRFASDAEFVLGTTEASVDGFADAIEISLIANVPWTAESSSSDFKVSPASGDSQEIEPQTITVTYTRNPSATDFRSATITFRTTSTAVKESTLKFTITQDPYQELKSDAVESWMELPAVGDEEGFVYISHSYDYYGKHYRNFSYWYDCRNKYATWLAYPLFTTSAATTRTDTWDYDPKIAKRYQPRLFSAFGVSGYARGHQVPSGDRTQCDEANIQTFYFTNITAQNSEFNGSIWMNLENSVREWAGGCDTLYVVTGALARKTAGEEITYFKDNEGKDVAVPKAYYKVLLRYRKNGTVNGGYDAIGFIYDNAVCDHATPTAADAKSVAELEKITGFDFFHNLPDQIETVVEQAANPGDWGLK